MRREIIGAVAGLFLAGACATAPRPPTRQLVESRTAVRVAEQTGADQDPQARLYLTVARQQIAEAERHMRDGSQWRAHRSLESAQVNAELAQSLARGARARAEAVATQREVDQLKTRVP